MPKRYTGRGERDFTSWLRDELVEDGAVVVPLVGGTMASHWPDRLVYHRDWHGLVELKAARGRVSDAQRMNMKKLWLRRPGHVWVVREPGVVEDPRDGSVVGSFSSGAQMVAEILELLRKLETGALS